MKPLRRPLIVFGAFCTCGWTGTGGVNNSVTDVNVQLDVHARQTADGFTHKLVGYNVACLGCKDTLSRVTPQPKYRCVDWAKRHKSLGCSR